MRALPIFSVLATMLAMVALPFSVAIPMPAPTIQIDLVPPEQEVEASGNETLVEIMVDVGVNKMPRQQVIVTLTASVDAGWPCKVVPDMMVFNELSLNPWQATQCCVTVPAGTANAMGELTVNGTSIDNGLVATASSKATITVNPFPPGAVNQTGNASNSSTLLQPDIVIPGGKNVNSEPGFLGLNQGILLPVVAASVLLIVTVSAGYALLRRKRQKNTSS